MFFDGTRADSSDEELAAIAPRHPVFRLDRLEGAKAAQAARGWYTGRSEVVAAAPRWSWSGTAPPASPCGSVADELGIRAPSLYKHVAGKAAIEVVLIEVALTEMGGAAARRPRAPSGPARPWRPARRLPRATPWPIPTSTGWPPPGRCPQRLEPGPGGLGRGAVLLATGDPHRAQALWAFAHGMVVLEMDGRFPAAPTSTAPGPGRGRLHLSQSSGRRDDVEGARPAGVPWTPGTMCGPA